VKSTPQFILQAFDRDLWFPVLEVKFEESDLKALQDILGERAADDPELRGQYEPSPEDVIAINTRYLVEFSTKLLGLRDVSVMLFRMSAHAASNAPYLIHTNYELPLLLDGRKKLANMYYEYPPINFPGEDRFDRWVAEGRLHKEVEFKPFKAPVDGVEGIRTAYYTPLGEEWRIEALKLVQRASAKSGIWNEHFERLEGMLYGYKDWEMDWWIDHRYAKRAVGD
jgi:hypothetical protein